MDRGMGWGPLHAACGFPAPRCTQHIRRGDSHQHHASGQAQQPLLAQYRQSDRDRIALGEDRNRAERTHADTDFLARELAALRIAIGEAITRNYLRDELQRAHHLLPAAHGTQPGQNNQHRPSWP